MVSLDANKNNKKIEPAIYGYCRISTPRQNIERQVRNIKNAYPTAIIIKEVYTGTSQERKDWRFLTRKVRSGDTIVFDSVSRMSRTAEEGFAEYKQLFEQGIILIFLKEPHINTEVYRAALRNQIAMTGTIADHILRGVNEYLMCLAEQQIRIAFEMSEKEVMDLRQRTREGILTAQKNGKKVGRVKGNTYETKKSQKCKKDILLLSKDFNGSLSDTKIIELLKISRQTYYKYKMELKKERMKSSDATECP